MGKYLALSFPGGTWWGHSSEEQLDCRLHGQNGPDQIQCSAARPSLGSQWARRVVHRRPVLSRDRDDARRQIELRKRVLRRPPRAAVGV